MEPVKQKSEFFKLVKATMNARHSVALLEDVKFENRKQEPVVFDLADTSKAIFIKIFQRALVADREQVVREIELHCSALRDAENFKSNILYIAFIFLEELTPLEKKFYHASYKSLQNFKIEFLYEKNILDFALAYEIDASTFLHENGVERVSDTNFQEDTQIEMSASEVSQLDSYARFIAEQEISIYCFESDTDEIEYIISEPSEKDFVLWRGEPNSIFWSIKTYDLIVLEVRHEVREIDYLLVNYVGKVIENLNDGKRLLVKWFHLGHYLDMTQPMNPIQKRMQKLTAYNFSKIIRGLGGLDKFIDRGLFDLTTETNEKVFDSLPKQETDKISFQLDQVSESDELGHRPVAKAFANLIKNDIFSKDLKHAFVVHLQGEWGAGKSTFLNLIKQELDGWIFVEYNAWQNQHIRPPWWTLINQVYIQSLRKLSGFEKFKLFLKERFRRIIWYSSWKNIMAFFAALLLAIFVFWNFDRLADLFYRASSNKDELSLADSIELVSKSILSIAGIFGVLFSVSRFFSTTLFVNSSKDAETFVLRSKDPTGQIKRHYEDLVSNIQGSKKARNLAIFIDDIDRCNKEYVVELMEGLQTLFKKQKVLFIIAGDKKWISTCFQKTFQDFETESSQSSKMIGDLFLQKMFQLSIRVPKVSPEMREKFWHKMIGYNKSEASKQKTTKDLSAEENKELMKEINNPDLNWSNANTISELQDKFDLSGDSISNLVIEKLNQSDTEFIHILQGYHSMLDINPRSIKRLANNYTMTRSTLLAERKDYEPDKIFRFLILDEMYPFLFEKFDLFNLKEDVLEALNENNPTKSEIERFEKLWNGINELGNEEMTLEEIKSFKGI